MDDARPTRSTDDEVDRHARVLLGTLPRAGGPTAEQVLAAVEALRPVVHERAGGGATPSRTPFVLVAACADPGQEAAAVEAMVPTLRLRGSALAGVLDRNHGPEGLGPYRPRIAKRAPKLGWCWDGNPHSWLGVASTAGRVVAPAA